jgi:hypothetical protein
VTNANPAEPLKARLQPGPGCLPPPRYGEALTADEHAHVATCPRCRTELALFAEFEAGAPAPDDGAAVQWIVRELGRRREAGIERGAPLPVVRRWWAGLVGRRLAPALVAAALVAAVGYLAWDREPALRDVPPQGDVYRSDALKLLDPIGEKKAAPPTFEWEAVPGVVQYDVSLLEVDGTILWRTTVTQPRVTVPPDVKLQFVPGKTLLWMVTARDAAGKPIRQSPKEAFRVAL